MTDRTSDRRPDLAGAFTALITPFTEAGREVDLARLDEQIEHQSLAGVRGLVPCGTTGETPTLLDREYEAVVQRTIERGHARGMLVIPGAGSNDTAHAVASHRFVADAGADAALHVTPYYNRPGQTGLERHFKTIADAADLPVVLYHVPGRTGTRLELDTIVRLAEHPNITAIKEASGDIDFATEIMLRTDLTVLSGDDPLTAPLTLAGASGVISVTANLLPGRVAALVLAAERGDWSEVRARHLELFPVSCALLSLDTNPVPIKAAMRLVGRDSGALRLPLTAATPDVERALRDILTPFANLNRVPDTVCA